MNDLQKTIAVKIMDREYRVKCPPENLRELQESARYLDKNMRNISKSPNILGLDRVAVLAALNITNDLLALKDQNNQIILEMEERIRQLHKQIQETLEKATAE